MSAKPKGLSGFTVAKNCLALDYCIVECINSMLPICDEVVVGEMGSTDGTRAVLREWMEREPKLRVVDIKDWTQERGIKTWFTSALNQTREELKFSHMLQLDADEILGDDPSTRDLIKQAVNRNDAFAFDRLNFARDACSLIPEGECCGKYVVRIGPSHLWLPSDEPHERGEIHILDMAHIQPAAKIFHMGFVRKPEAFFAKARVVLGAFFDGYDGRLEAAEDSGVPPLSGFEWWRRLTPYTGYYPRAVREWMEARGYIVP